MESLPKDVGILGIAIYVPRTYVKLPSESIQSVWNSLTDNEQNTVSITGDREDVVSMGLTVLARLLQNYSIDPSNVGRLEVATSDLSDKSKSIKTYMMSLFKESGNYNIEGITSHASSYGAVQAFYNSVAWIESRAWDGRYAIVIAVDSLEDGAGAIALLIGPNAALVLEPGRATYMSHEYDLYFPDFKSTVFTTEGDLHHQTYTETLIECYNLIQQNIQFRELRQLADYFIFHVPSIYIARRAVCCLTVRDIDQNPQAHGRIVEAARKRRFDLNNRTTYEMVKNYSEQTWQDKIEPVNLLVKHVGNLGCGAVFGSLCSLISNKGRDLEGMKIMMFGFGSGVSGSMFLLRARDSAQLDRLQARCKLEAILSDRICIDEAESARRKNSKKERYGKKNWMTEDSLDELQENTYYLIGVDDRWRRSYAVKSAQHAKL